MKKLVKIRLINWYSFYDETIEIKGNTLITGENGSGKSTILDAIQYVLTAGTCKFNAAATDIGGKRSIESYMRYKTGKEGQENLRTGDVITHVALEFFDEQSKRPQVVGVVSELPQVQNSAKSYFYCVANETINDLKFTDDNNVIFRAKEYFKKIDNQSLVYDDTKKRAKTIIARSLQIKEKYMEFVPKALAFRAIDNVYKFIMDFLLKEDNVEINDLTTSIRDYRRLELKFKECETECDYLEKIVDLSKDYENKVVEEKILGINIDLEKHDSLEKTLASKTKELNRLRTELKSVVSKVNTLNEEFNNKNNEFFKLDQELENNDIHKLIKEESTKFDHLKEEIRRIEANYKEVVRNLENEASILRKLKVRQDFIDYVNAKDYDTITVNKYLAEIKDYYDKRKDEISEEGYNLKSDLIKLQKDIKDVNYKLDRLKDNKRTYGKEIERLKEILIEKLSGIFGKRVEVHTLAELVEINDDKWRNAIEGYLNTQKFDIILAPEYYTEAVKIYESYAKEKGLHSIGIVNTNRTSQYKNIDVEGSLASKIDAENDYARGYAYMLLHKVMMVDTVSNGNYNTMITKNCMLYKNFVARVINPKNYEVPYIGKEALRIQREKLEKELVELNDNYKLKKARLADVDRILDLISSSKLSFIEAKADNIDLYKTKKQSYDDSLNYIEKLKDNPDYISVAERFEVVKRQKNQLYNELESCRISMSRLENSERDAVEVISKTEADIGVLSAKLDKMQNEDEALYARSEDYYLNLKRQYGLDRLENIINNRCNGIKNEIYQLSCNVVSAMISYNNKYDYGFGSTIEAITDFKNRYHSLKDIDLEKNRNATISAKEKCTESFRTSFVEGLKEKIEEAKKEIKDLNNTLKQRVFNNETYEFICQPTKNKDFAPYYDIMTSGRTMNSTNLFSEDLTAEEYRTMEDLFTKLTNVENDRETDKFISRYTDYRNYLHFDIKINYLDGTYALFSKVNKEKSGGETQTPFYVIMAASFEQIINNKGSNEDFGCVVIFDEAFNNMDEKRIEEMIKFYDERAIQTIIAVPPTRINAIMPYVDTNLAIVKSRTNPKYSGIIEVKHE